MARNAHLVGSLPFGSADEAMRSALERLGQHLWSLPDGETGERRNWIIHIVESLRAHPDLDVRREGSWGDYDDTLQFRIRRGRRLDGRSLDFGHVADFEASYPAFRRLRDASGHHGLAFQVGIPGDFDMALFSLGPTGPLRHRLPFTVATLREIHAIHARGGDDVVLQLELPAELVAVAQVPAPLRPVVAAWLARGVAQLARRSPDGARFGIHLCLGDMNHRALGRMRDVAPLVTLANAILGRWPAGPRLEYVHAPFAAAEQPPPPDPSFYAPLRDLDLPAGTRFVAGIVHEDRDLDEQRRILDLIDSHVGGRVDVATSCGLGRRDAAGALATLDRAAALCDAST